MGIKVRVLGFLGFRIQPHVMPPHFSVSGSALPLEALNCGFGVSVYDRWEFPRIGDPNIVP